MPDPLAGAAGIVDDLVGDLAPGWDRAGGTGPAWSPTRRCKKR
ncbi:hypothetical protein STBA_49810 [Streptomyces sp. MP131-18]|nr:hypothetical protein STBA_49810 [Streptomyces sp. MP131-18]